MDDHEEMKKKVLRDQLPYLRQSLGDPCGYIPYLVQGDVFDSHDANFIRSKATSKEKLETFLWLLIKDRKDVSAFDVFVTALEDLRIQIQVARRLQRTLAYEKEAAQNVDTTVGLDNGVQYIRDIVNDQFSKDEMIEAIKYCNMDAAAALYHLFEKATHVATNDTAAAATVNSTHRPTTIQSTIVTTAVQSSPVYQQEQATTTVQEQYPSTVSFEGASKQCNQQDVKLNNNLSTAKQSSNTIPSSTRTAKQTTTQSMRSIGVATFNAVLCPFSDPQWNVTVLSHKFDHKGGTLHIHEHNVDIIIPQHAVSIGDVVEVQAAVVLSGPYKMPSGYDPISVTVWVGASYKFNKLVKISIPHCAITNGPQDINGLVVLTTMTQGCTEFTVNTNRRRTSQEIEHPNYYCYEVNNQCCDYYTDHQCGSICLARRSFQPTTLSVMVFCWKPRNYQSADKVSIELCFCYNLKHSIKSIKKAYKTRNPAKPQMGQWNVEVDSRKRQKICMTHSINVPGTPAVIRRCSKKVDIGDLGYFFQSHAMKTSVFLPQLDVCFTRGQESMCKDLIINFRIDVESDGARLELQKDFTFSLKLDKLISANDRLYNNLPCNSDQPTTTRATDHSQEHVQGTSNNTVNNVATMANHMRDNLSSTAARGNVFVNNIYMIQAGHNVSFANSSEEPKCAVENDVKNNYLQSFSTDIATTLDVNTIQMQMMNYGLLTREQQEYLCNPAHTPCAKGRKLCTIILSFNESCVKKFIQCLAETSDYEPHRELLQKIRQHSSNI